jgi:hypothetical protein
MTTKNNTIEEIRTDATIINKSAAYISACDKFELEASKFATNESFISRKCAEEVSLSFSRAKLADCEYSIYTAAHAAEVWLKKAVDNAD